MRHLSTIMALGLLALPADAIAQAAAAPASGVAGSERQYTRVPLPRIEEMTEEQKTMYENSIRLFGAPTGPTIPFIYTHNINKAWRGYLDEITKSKLPRNLWELSILVVAREWSSPIEWYMHSNWAKDRGVPPAVIEDIRLGRTPTFATPQERAVYEFTLELQRSHRVSDATYNRLRDQIGQVQLIELVALIAHYNKVAITLAAHDAQLPPGAKVDLPDLRANHRR